MLAINTTVIAARLKENLVQVEVHRFFVLR